MTSRRRTPAERALDAEVRFVTEGHRARLGGDGVHMLVTSDTRPGVTYRLRVWLAEGLVSFTCDHSRYDGDGSHYPGRALVYGTVPCKHGAGCARRLEREGLLTWEDGRWLPTPKAFEVAAPADDSDPFDGLPGCER